MPANNLQNVTCLNTPRKNFVRIERTRKNDVLRLVNLQAGKLALLIWLELPELLVLDHVVCVDASVQAAGKEGVFVGELDISNLGLMLLKSSKAEPADFIPEFDLTIVGAGGDEFVFVEVNGLGFVNEALLVDDVTLGLPLPDDDLAESFEAETDPGTGGVDGECTDFVLTDRESLNFGEFLIEQLVNGELALAVGGGKKTVAWIVKNSLEVFARLGHN